MKKTNPLRSTLNALFGSEEVIGSNPIFSTDKASEKSGAFFGESETKSGTKARIKNPQNSFSAPFIHTGKLPICIPRGSTKLAELAKNRWYVEFYFHDNTSGACGPNSIHDSFE